jgi:hypothetical protein
MRNELEWVRGFVTGFAKWPLTHSYALTHHLAHSPQGGEGTTTHAALAAPVFFAAIYAATGNE